MMIVSSTVEINVVSMAALDHWKTINNNAIHTLS